MGALDIELAPLAGAACELWHSVQVVGYDFACMLCVLVCLFAIRLTWSSRPATRACAGSASKALP